MEERHGEKGQLLFGGGSGRRGTQKVNICNLTVREKNNNGEEEISNHLRGKQIKMGSERSADSEGGR